MSTDLAQLPLHALAAKLKSRSISPVDIVATCLERIARLDPKLHAFVEVYETEARLAAEAADKAIRSGHAVGPLHGIPIALKDLIELEGRVATGGTAVWRDRRATRTATLAQKLISAGMIVIGKTHTVEFAFGGWGTNQHLGTPWNPWDAKTHRTPGGSSSGSGVAVAARMVPCALGTDTGGSVRVPAAWCGITGLKTTIGRISTYGVLPLSPTLDTPGPMTRSVEDAALLLQVMQGADPRDPRTLALRDADPMPTLRRGVKGLRLARMAAAERDGVAADVLAAYDRSVEQLASMGADIVDLTLPRSFRDYGSTSGRIMAAEAYALLSQIVDNNELPVDEAVRPRDSGRCGDLLTRIPRGAGRTRAVEAGVRRRHRARRRAAGARHDDAGHPDRHGRPEHDAGLLHALGQLPRSVRAGRAQRVHHVRVAAVAADRLPRRRRGDGVAHRLGLAECDRLARAYSADGPVTSRA